MLKGRRQGDRRFSRRNSRDHQRNNRRENGRNRREESSESGQESDSEENVSYSSTVHQKIATADPVPCRRCSPSLGRVLLANGSVRDEIRSLRGSGNSWLHGASCADGHGSHEINSEPC